MRTNENPLRYTFAHERTSPISQAEGGELHRVIIQSHIRPPKVLQSRIDRRQIHIGKFTHKFRQLTKKTRHLRLFDTLPFQSYCQQGPQVLRLLDSGSIVVCLF